ncbi:MAG: hypothetical protein FD136_1021 [Chitinophagaceae bacterium]|nr:MAG: hypothetical protein FD136_1021 [Chitinophagaceae bacterium]
MPNVYSVEAAVIKRILGGIGKTLDASTITDSANPPHPLKANTRSPGLIFFTLAPTADIIPATSPPGEKGKGGLN